MKYFLIVLMFINALNAFVIKSNRRFEKLEGWTKSFVSKDIPNANAPVLEYWMEKKCCGTRCEKQCDSVKLQIRYRFAGQKHSVVVGNIIIPGPSQVIKKS